MTAGQYGLGNSSQGSMTNQAFGGMNPSMLTSGSSGAGGLGSLLGGGGSSGMMAGGGAMGAIGAGVQALGGLAQTAMSIASAFDDPGAEAGVLPQEFQIGLVNMVNSQLNYVQNSLKTTQNLYDQYSQRLNLAQGWLSGSMSSQDAKKGLTQTNANIGGQLGMSPQDMFKNGLIGSQEQQLLTEAYQQSKGNFLDPVLAQQQKEQRRQLQQDLSRQGVPAAQQAIALQQFDQNSNMANFQRSQQQAFGTLGLLNAYSGQKQQGLQNYLGLAGQQYQAGLGNINNQLGLYGQAGAAYKGLEGTMLSDETRALIQGGVIGPGTGYQQTGVPLQYAQAVADRVANQNIANYRGRLSTYDQGYVQNNLQGNTNLLYNGGNAATTYQPNKALFRSA